MDRPTADSDPGAPDSAARGSLAQLSRQPRNQELALAPGLPTSEAVALVWSGLCAGRLRIVHHAQDEFCTVVHLEERRPDQPSRWAIRGRTQMVLQRVLGGQSLNFISLDLALSTSTVSAEFQYAMRTLGLTPRLSTLPMYLAQLWHASRMRPIRANAVRSSWRGIPYTSVSLPRPELNLASVLSRAELEVSTMLLQGKTHAEIASVRGTSVRTVANQLASIFAKLNVSGRLQLVTSLAQGRTHWCNARRHHRATRALLD